MPIHVVCRCGNPLIAAEAAVGNSAKCPACGQEVLMTAPSDTITDDQVLAYLGFETTERRVCQNNLARVQSDNPVGGIPPPNHESHEHPRKHMNPKKTKAIERKRSLSHWLSRPLGCLVALGFVGFLVTQVVLLHVGGHRQSCEFKLHWCGLNRGDIRDIQKLKEVVDDYFATEDQKSRAAKAIARIENDPYYRFQQNYKRFQNAFWWQTVPESYRSSDALVLRGKAYVVTRCSFRNDSYAQIIDEVMQALGERAAGDPDEVRTLIQLDYERTQIGEYTGSSGGNKKQYKYSCRITTFDLKFPTTTPLSNTLIVTHDPETYLSKGFGDPPGYNDLNRCIVKFIVTGHDF